MVKGLNHLWHRQGSAKVHHQRQSPSSISLLLFHHSHHPSIPTLQIMLNSLVAPEIFNRTQPPLALKSQKEKVKHLPSFDIFCTLHRRIVFWGGENKYYIFLWAYALLSSSKCHLKKLFPSNISLKCQKLIGFHLWAELSDVTSHSDIGTIKLWPSLFALPLTKTF